MPFSPTGYVPQYGDRIMELMMRQGEIAARGAERSGLIWGRAIENLGQIAGNAVEQHQQDKIAKQKDEGIYSVMQSWDGQDPTVLVKGLATYIGLVEAVKVAGGLQKLMEAKQVPQLDASHIAGPVGALAALERSSPGHLQRNWSLIFPQIESLAKQAGLPVAPEWSEDMTQGVMTLDQQFNPPKAASAPPFQEVNGQGFERGPQGWAPAPGLPTAAPKAEKTLDDIRAESQARAEGTHAGSPPPQRDPIAAELALLRLEEAKRNAAAGQGFDKMPAEWQNVASRAALVMPANRRAEYDRTISRVFATGDKGELASVVKQAAIEGENVDVKNQVVGRMATIASLEDAGKILVEMKAKGVPTNWLAGNIEDLARRLGTTTNPEYVALGNRLMGTLINYRRAATGVQFGDKEAAQYERMFPNYRQTLPVNEALIKGLMREMKTYDRVYWEYKLGKEGAKLVGALPSETPSGGAKKVYFDAQGNMVGGQ